MANDHRAPPPARERRGRLRRLASAPTLHFLLLGALACAVLPPHGSEPQPLVISGARIEQAAREWRARFGESLSEKQRRAMTDELTREAVLADYARSRGMAEAEPVRQRLIKLARFLDLVEPDATGEQALRAARELGLHRSDAVIRRFLANAGELVLASQTDSDAVARSDIETYYRDHRDRFREPAVIDLHHVYIAATGSEGERRAAAILAGIRREGWSADEAIQRGDVFLRGHEFDAMPLPRIATVLGGEVGDRLSGLPDDQWSPPVRSAYGWHLLHKATVTAARVAPLSTVEGKIRSLLERQRQRAAVARQVAGLRERYQVVIGDEG